MGGKRLASISLLHVSTETESHSEVHSEIRLLFWKRIWTRFDERDNLDLFHDPADFKTTELCTFVKDVRKLSDYFVLEFPDCLPFESFHCNGSRVPRYCFSYNFVGLPYGPLREWVPHPEALSSERL